MSIQTENAVKFIEVIKNNIDPNISSHDFRFWQNMSGTIKYEDIKATNNGFKVVYYILLTFLFEGNFVDLSSFISLIGKPELFGTRFSKRLSISKPKFVDFIADFSKNKDKKLKELKSKYVIYKKSKGEYTDEVQSKMKFVELSADQTVSMRSMSETLSGMLDTEMHSPEVRQLFDHYQKSDTDIYNLYDEMIKKMGADLMATKNILLNSCMMAMIGYYNDLKKRLDNGDTVPYYEMREAYKILKTEMAEPIHITESRQKNLDVRIEFPMSPEQIQKYMDGNSKNMDLSINVADQFKSKVVGLVDSKGNIDSEKIKLKNK